MTTGRINQIAILRATAKDDRRLHFHHRQTRDVHKVTPPSHRRREVSGIRNCGPRKRIRKALQNEVTQSLPRGSPPSSTHCTLRYKSTLPAVASFPAGTAPPPKCFIGNQHAPLQTPTHRQRGLAERTATRKNSARTSPRSPPSKIRNHIRCFACYQLAIHRTDPNPAQNCPETTPQQLWDFPTPSPEHRCSPPGTRRAGPLNPVCRE